MIDDDRRQLYGRPAPGATPPLLSAPVAEPTEPAVAPTEPVLESPARAPRRRTVLMIGAGTVAVAVAVIAAAAVLLLRPPAAPSLAVFDREPTAQEAQAEQRLTDQGAFFFADSAVEARMILELPATTQSDIREIWALRTDASEQVGFPYVIICLSTDLLVDDGGPLACMEEPDLARRGFIPLDQPRPSVVVDGDVRVIEWGPTGDARLVDPPEPPQRDGARS